MTTRSSPSLATVGGLMFATLLTACGGGGGGEAPPPAPPAPAPTSSFTQRATWVVTLPASGSSVCYDFDSQIQTADCTGTAWDLKLRSSGMTASLWTNSGTSGTGQGAAPGGPFDYTWATLQTWQNGTTEPSGGTLPEPAWLKDASSSVFTGSNAIQTAAFEYGINGDHLLYPNFRTFLVTTNTTAASNTGSAGSPVFALQFTGYYGGAGGTASGYPSFRFVDRATPGTVHTATVNASAGWVYYDLVNRAEVASTGSWHIAFNRYNVRLNGGESGTGTVGGFLAKTPAGFYAADGALVPARFSATTNLADTLADLSASDLAVPATAARWVRDATTSPLSPVYRGAYPNPLNYGWVTYYPTATAAQGAGLPAVAHLIRANPDNAALLRSGTGDSYARFRLASVDYATPSNASSTQTWTFQFDVQPRR